MKNTNTNEKKIIFENLIRNSIDLELKIGLVFEIIELSCNVLQKCR